MGMKVVTRWGGDGKVSVLSRFQIMDTYPSKFENKISKFENKISKFKNKISKFKNKISILISSFYKHIFIYY